MKRSQLFPLFLSFVTVVFICMKCADAFLFSNDTSHDIYIILDLNPKDGRVTAGSEIDYVRAHGARYEGRKVYDPWREAVKDSMHIYILDAAKVDLPINLITEEQIRSIPQDAYVARMTVLQQQVDEDITFPPASSFKCVYYQ